jgi:hypothetical protein
MTRDGDSGTLARYAPYAMIFGLTALMPTGLRGSSGAAGSEAHTADFAARWQKAWATAAPPGTRPRWDSVPAGRPSHSDVSSFDYYPGYGHHGGGFDAGHGGPGGGHF